MMVIPLLIGCAVNTFVPQCLEIGGFTTALFKSGQSTLVGLFIFCSGATINVKQVGKPLYKGAVLTILKLVIGVIIGYLLNLILVLQVFLVSPHLRLFLQLQTQMEQFIPHLQKNLEMIQMSAPLQFCH